jgi:hypothetical protein
MWRRRITRRAPAATTLIMTSLHYSEARKSISNHSTSLEDDKSSSGVAGRRVLLYYRKRLSTNQGRQRRHDCNSRSNRVRSIREGHIIKLI